MKKNLYLSALAINLALFFLKEIDDIKWKNKIT